MIYNDFKRSGKCRLFIAKEQFSQNLFSFALQKSDPMTKSLSDEWDYIIKIHKYFIFQFIVKFFINYNILSYFEGYYCCIQWVWLTIGWKLSYHNHIAAQLRYTLIIQERMKN